MLVYWCAGKLVCWYTGVLVYWCAGILVHWYNGVPSPDADYDRPKQIAGTKYFEYIGSMITSDASPTREVKSKIVMEKAAFNKKNTSPTNGK